MGRLSRKLSQLIKVDEPIRADVLTSDQKKILRSLKTESYKASRGRSIQSCEFDINDGGLVVIFEGSDCFGVAKQIARRFKGMDGIVSSLIKDGDRLSNIAKVQIAMEASA